MAKKKGTALKPIEGDITWTPEEVARAQERARRDSPTMSDLLEAEPVELEADKDTDIA